MSADRWKDPTRSLNRLKSVESQLTSLFVNYRKRVIAELSPAQQQPFTHTQKAPQWFTGIDIKRFFQRLEDLSMEELIGPANRIIEREIPDAFTHGTKYADINIKATMGIRLGAPLEARQETWKKIGVLVEKAKGEFKGVSDATNQQIRRVISDGMVNEQSLKTVSQSIQDATEGIGENRARMIARTETMKAINTAAVDRYKEAGIQNVSWLAAEDERVCEICGELDGQVFPIDEAPECPAHVNCRCTLTITEESLRMTQDEETTQKHNPGASPTMRGLYKILNRNREDLQSLKKLDRPRDLQDMDDVYPDCRACPFPYSDERPSAKEIYTAKVTRKEILLSKLWATQYAVDKEKVKKILDDLKSGKYEDNPEHADKIAVVHDSKTGRYLIQNGHHHCVALAIHGEKEAYVVIHIDVKRQ